MSFYLCFLIFFELSAKSCRADDTCVVTESRDKDLALVIVASCILLNVYKLVEGLKKIEKRKTCV